MKKKTDVRLKRTLFEERVEEDGKVHIEEHTQDISIIKALEVLASATKPSAVKIDFEKISESLKNGDITPEIAVDLYLETTLMKNDEIRKIYKKKYGKELTIERMMVGDQVLCKYNLWWLEGAPEANDLFYFEYEKED